MKKIYFVLFTIIAFGGLFGCLKDPDIPGGVMNAKKPNIKTVSLGEVTANTVVISAEVTQDNGLPVLERGVCWFLSSSTSVDTLKNKLTSDKGLGEFTVKIQGLEPHKSYCILPYAINDIGVAYGEKRVVETNTGLGTVKTLEPTDINAASVTCGAKITVPGEGDILEKGFYLSYKNQSPTAEDSIIYNTMETDSFTCLITELKPSTTYYVRAFVKNNFGFFNEDSEVRTFTTSSGVGEVLMLEIEPDSIKATSVFCAAKIVSPGEGEIIERGFKLSYKQDDTTTKDSTIYSSMETDSFSCKITNLKPLTQYRVKAFVKNSFGYYIEKIDPQIFNTPSGLGTIKTNSPEQVTATTAICGGKIESKGESEIIKRGIYFSLSTNPTAKDSVIYSSLKTDSFTYKLTDLKPNTTYYVRAFATNELGTFEGGEKSFKTPTGVPQVEALTVGEIKYTNVALSAEVTSEGDAPVTQRGFCWSINENPQIGDNSKPIGNGLGTFSTILTGLESEKKYFVRAYAINKFGTVYSNEQWFYTKSDLPIVKSYVVNENDFVKGVVKIQGEVLDEGMTSVIESGICWSSTVAQPTIMDSKVELASGLGVYRGEIKGLKGGTTYNLRAYARNEKGISYGDVVTFTTPSVLTTKAAFTGDNLIPGSVSTFTLKDRGYFIGGDLGPSYTDELWTYDATGDMWQPLKAYPAGKRKWQTAIGAGDIAYIFGGMNENDEFTKEFYYYTVRTNTWRALSSVSPDAACQVAGCSIDNSIYLIGGRRDTIMDEVWHYNPYGSIWERKNAFPVKQYGGIALTVKNTIYAGLGMSNLSGSSTYKRLWSSSNLNSWTEETSMPSNAGNPLCGVVHNDAIYVLDENGLLWKYDIEKKTWSKKSQIQIDQSGFHCMFSLNDHIYIGLGNYSNLLICYDPYWDN